MSTLLGRAYLGTFMAVKNLRSWLSLMIQSSLLLPARRYEEHVDMNVVKQHAKSIEAAGWVLLAAYTIKQDAICATLFFVNSILLRLLWEVSRLIPNGAILSRILLAVPTIGVAYIWLTLTPAQILITTPMDFWSPYQTRPPLKNFEELYRPNASIDVDIIAIHGLGSNPDKAWTCRNGTHAVSWLREILPEQGFESARVMMVNHQTRWDSRSPNMELSDHAAHLLGHIEDVHTDPIRPIIFIAHSFGGILLKKSLLMALGQKSSHIAAATKGIIFLGVPHAGSSFTKVASMLACTATWRGSDTRLLRFMSEHSKDIYELDKDFRRSYPPSYLSDTEGSVYICNFAEMRPEETLGIVIGPTVNMHPGASGYPRNRWLDADHRGMNKFCSADDPNMKVILEELKGIFAALRRSKLISVPSHSVKATGLRSSLGIPVTQHFIGRDYTLNQVHSLLWMSNPPKLLDIVSIYAAGGMGKTQTAMAYLQNYGKHFGAIFEVDGTSLVTCCTSFHRIREFLGSGDPVVEQEYEKWKESRENATFGNEGESQCMMDCRLVHGWLLRWQGLPWLLLFDNVDDLETFDVRDFFPYNAQGKLLITSRRPESCEWSQWRCIKLSELHREDSKALFQKQLFLKLLPDSRAAELLDNVLDKLGDMPLAVAQASAYISRRLVKFRDTQHKILKKLEAELMAYETAFSEQLQKQSSIALRDYHNDSILTTWEISFRAIQNQDRTAAELLQLMGFLNRRDLNPELLRYAILPSYPTTASFPFSLQLRKWTDLAKSQWSDVQLDFCFDLYVSYSLLEYREDSNTFSMHPLIHNWIRLRLSRPTQIYYATQAMRLVETGWTLQLRPVSHTEDIFGSFREYFSTATIEDNAFHLDPDALLAQTWPEWLENTIQKIMLLWGILDDAILGLTKLFMLPHSRLVAVPWRYAYTLGDRVDHIGLVQWSYQEACSRLNYRHPFSLKIAGSYTNLLPYEDESNIPWYTWLTEVRTRTYGLEHPSTAGALHGMAAMLLHANQFQEADILFNKALMIRMKALGFEDKLTQNVLYSKKSLIRQWANRTAAISFVQELYESGRLCYVLGDSLLSSVFGIVLYQAVGPNSTLVKLYETNSRDCAVLALAMKDLQWVDLVSDSSAVTCNFRQPGWCQCLHFWDELLGSDWTVHSTVSDPSSNEIAMRGQLDECQGDDCQVQAWSENCDISLKRELEYNESIDATQRLLQMLQNLAADSYHLELRTSGSQFNKWYWIEAAGFDSIVRLLNAGECEFAGALARAVYELTDPREPCYAFLVAQSYACQEALEESCRWYAEAQRATKNIHITCHETSHRAMTFECWTSVVHWATGICQWMSGNFHHGQKHIIHALEAGNLLDYEIEWILYDLQMARERFGVYSDELHVVTFQLVREGQSRFMFHQMGSLESGNGVLTSAHGNLVSMHGSDIASDWYDCYESDYLSENCKQFQAIKTYSISNTTEEHVIKSFVSMCNTTSNRYLQYTYFARIPKVHRTCTPGSTYSRSSPPRRKQAHTNSSVWEFFF